MGSNWEFDKEFLRNNIYYGKRLLKSFSLSLRQRRYIRSNIRVLTNLFDGNYNVFDEKKVIRTTDLEKLKVYALNKMRVVYKTLGPDLINFFLELTLNGIFDIDDNFKDDMTNLDLDSQVDMTLENYSGRSIRYLKVAEEIIRGGKQIQAVSDLNSSSYCIYNDLTKSSYMVVNPNEAPWVFNHELQHMIEDVYLYQNHDFYDELGPQYFELLFLDVLYDRQGYLFKGDYFSKLDDARYFLDVLFSYFSAILVFAQSNFEVSLDRFTNVIMEIYEVDIDTFYTVLKEELAPGEPIKDMNYLFSYLKAIELREKTFILKKNSDSILEPYIGTRKFKFYPPRDILVYDRFVNEMTGKTKVLSK